MIKQRKCSLLYYLLSPIKQYIKLALFRSKWRKNNKDNKTTVSHIFPIDLVSVGRESYGDLCVYSFGGDHESLSIGNYCSIAGDVVFILGGEHPLHYFSTFPFGRFLFGIADNSNLETRGKIVIKDDVWIGHGVIVLSGATIGQGAVVGAGSVVRGNIPPYAIYIGSSIKGYRFSETICKELIKIDYSTLSQEQLKYIKEQCLHIITEQNVNEIVCNIENRRGI